MQYVSQTGDEEIDTIYQDYFHEWCESADLTGRHRLRDLVWMMMWACLATIPLVLLIKPKRGMSEEPVAVLE